MKRFLSLVCALLFLLGISACNSAPDPTTHLPTDPEDTFLIGVLCPDDSSLPENDSGLHIKQLTSSMRRNTLDTKAQLALEENIPADSAAVHDAIKRLIQNGADLIFSLDKGYADTVAEAAKDHPNVIFCQYDSGEGNGANLVRYYAPVYRVYAVLGAAAGQRSLALACDSIGFVSLFGPEDPEATAAVNAFTVAARMFNPDISVKLKVVEPGGEGEAARALIQESGCKILAQYGGGSAVLSVARELSAKACGPWFSNSERSKAGHLLSPEYNWTGFYTRAIKAATDCNAADFAKKLGTDSYCGTVCKDKDSVLTVTDPGPGAGEYTYRILPYMQGSNTVVLYNLETEDPNDGKTLRLGTYMDLFCGWRFSVTRFDDVYTTTKFDSRDLKDREGNMIVPAGGICLKSEEIEAMDYYLEGVDPVG